MADDLTDIHEDTADGDDPPLPPSQMLVEAEHRAAILVEYEGTAYHGWSRQPGHVTVEGAIRQALERVAVTPLAMCCAGRTDAGVHATGQVVSLAWNGSLGVDRICVATARHLPQDIALRRAVPVSAGFDARNDALARSYRYRVLPTPIHAPLRDRQVMHHPRTLDRAALDAVAELTCGRHDFTAFTPSKTLHRHFHRTIAECAWEPDGDELVLSITSDAFLRSMVRVLVGTMLAVGRGDMTVEQYQALLAGAPRADAWATAPARGLCLVGVSYDPDPFAR